MHERDQRPVGQVSSTNKAVPTDVLAMPRKDIGTLQRARVLSAIVDLSYEHGVQATTVAQIVGRAAVSRATFYSLFADRGDCFRAAFDHAVDEIETLARTAFLAERGWAAQIRAALAVILDFLEANPRIANACVVESLAAGSATLEARSRVVARLARVLDAGRSERPNGPASVTAEGLVGGAVAIVHTRLTRADERGLTSLLNPLMSMIVMPYLGPQRAQQELGRGRPGSRSPTREQRSALSGSVSGLNMRLTYRTLRVLTTIAETPGLNNREIGKRADIVDQGQISKLLRRLASLGLIENSGQGQTHGQPNEWLLSNGGSSLLRAVGHQLE